MDQTRIHRKNNFLVIQLRMGDPAFRLKTDAYMFFDGLMTWSQLWKLQQLLNLFLINFGDNLNMFMSFKQISRVRVHEWLFEK